MAKKWMLDLEIVENEDELKAAMKEGYLDSFQDAISGKEVAKDSFEDDEITVEGVEDTTSKEEFNEDDF